METKEITQFYRHAAMGDGRLGFCKECTKERIRNARLDPRYRDKMLAYEKERRRTKKRKHLELASGRRRRKRNSTKYRANTALSNARRRGAVRPKPCWVCGTNEKIQGHHYDYDKPLEVLWLCHEHHLDMHRQIRLLKIEL